MIGKQTKGKSFSGLLKYVLGKDQAEMIGGNMAGTTPQELSKEFGEIRKLKPQMNRPVYHASLSLPHGERLSDTQWNGVAKQYLDKMGFGNSQYVAVRHRDTEHDHIHIVANRIGMNGKVVSESHDYRRSETIIRGLEVEHNLSRVLPSREAGKRGLTSGELYKTLRTHEASTKLRLQHLIDQAAYEKPNMSEFIGRLQASNVEVGPYRSKTGHISGIRYSLDGEIMKGSNLGRAYTWHGLQQQKGIHYEQNRDRPAIDQAIGRFPNGANLHAHRGQAPGSIRGHSSELRVSNRTVGSDIGENSFRDKKQPGFTQGQLVSLSRGISALYSGSQRASANRSGSPFPSQAQSGGHMDGINPFNLGSSYERVLRVGASFERGQGRDEVENRSRESSPEMGRKRSKIVSGSRGGIREALRPFDLEKQRIEREREEEARQRRIEKAKELEQEQGQDFGIGL